MVIWNYWVAKNYFFPSQRYIYKFCLKNVKQLRTSLVWPLIILNCFMMQKHCNYGKVVMHIWCIINQNNYDYPAGPSLKCNTSTTQSRVHFLLTCKESRCFNWKLFLVYGKLIGSIPMEYSHSGYLIFFT